ncbi:DUF6882 domain-containing protein [Nocardiopsis alba]|uniref:Uncharacterized protein n=1 Tax=Nocardiopsis alba TaxID=53437 RepID=A0A7K2ITU0_9ACTN|nr:MULTISPECIES: DUF6882 domain-containing protein [Nocardiopsis]MEC3893757.1 hypothetical protein [Nocardiopsis sp. LDBS1602]MYR33343.1 hypothetical protein [Nocardiopsis alba]
MSKKHTLPDMLDDAALLSLEHQIHLEEFLGEHNWHVDLQAARFEFTGERPLICERFHLLGSAAPGPRSWMWGWANPSGFPEELTALGAAVRDFGRDNEIPELADPEVPFATLPGSPEEAHLALHPLTEAAKLLTGRWFSYNGDAGGGTRVAFIIEHPDLRLPAPVSTRVMRILQEGISGLRLFDHKRAVYTYARLRGLSPRFVDAERSGITLGGADFTFEVSFDEHNRISGIEGNLSGASTTG